MVTYGDTEYHIAGDGKECTRTHPRRLFVRLKLYHNFYKNFQTLNKIINTVENTKSFVASDRGVYLQTLRGFNESFWKTRKKLFLKILLQL